uniref:Uncharacterized protein n=1 Tax=Candidatus Kentrum sp. TUN TaxID=2126343 RepID=A0A450ZAT9_9GAMM|nr:MAG: hypothetical protein BECKTUN1418D_GA0071000_100324 [Candidatus Kentron sp. TUN]VFK52081.1 MAG: hypothetical protein BECKTUN1418E_GA0071001_100718 [Candidatus Kentron sp. TUN]VFK52132.1 MAG: hypothetical protein BECKTUN1418F_GA0071002_100517 [Candidatus Kentron sp. TUN]
MKNTSHIKFTIAFTDPDFDFEDRDKEVQNLLHRAKDLEVIKAGRVPDPNPPEGAKAMGGFLAGVFAMEVLGIHLKEILDYLRDTLSNKAIELEVEADGRKLKVKAADQAQLEIAIQAAEKFIKSKPMES